MRSQIFNLGKVIRNLRSFFDKKRLDQLAKSTGFVKRKRVMDGSTFVALCMGIDNRFDTSLVEMCTFLSRLGISMAAESLNQRFNRDAVEFMKQVFNESLEIELQDGRYDFLDRFNGIFIQDATGYQLPDCYQDLYRGSGGGATNSAIKLDLVYNYQDANWLKIKICEGTSPDYKQSHLTYSSGSLVLRDLGYLKMDDLGAIDKCNAFYVSRLRNDIGIFDARLKIPLDPLRISRKMKVNQVVSMDVLIGRQRLKCRLVIKKLTKKDADDIRDKIQHDKNNKRKGLTKRRLDLCSVKMFITNMSEEEISHEEVINLYRLRWQIELLFKSWKGTFDLETVKAMKWERFESMLYGCLIRAVLNFKLMVWIKCKIFAQTDKELSEMKAIRNIEIHAKQWVNIICRNSRYSYQKFLAELLIIMRRFCIKQPKKGKHSPLNLLLT